MAVFSAELTETRRFLEANGKDIRRTASALVEFAEVSLLVATPFLGPEVTIPAAVGLALADTVIQHPPRLDVLAKQLAGGQYQKAVVGTVTYGCETVRHMVGDNAPHNLIKAVGSFSVWAYKGLGRTTSVPQQLSQS